MTYKYKFMDGEQAEKEEKQLRFVNLMGDIFAVLLIFDLMRGFFGSNLFAYINCLVWFGFFISCLIAKTHATLRLDIYYKT